MKDNQKVAITKQNLKKKSYYTYQLSPKKKSYKENLLQPHKLDHTKKNKKAITRMLKTPLNELQLIFTRSQAPC